MGKHDNATRSVEILLLDNSKEWDGNTIGLLELLKHIDRDRFEITCYFTIYYNYRRDNKETIGNVLNAMGILTQFIVQRRQLLWAKLGKEVLRQPIAVQHCLAANAPNARRITDLLRVGKCQLLYMNNQPSSNIEGCLAAESLPVGCGAATLPYREPLLDLPLIARVN